VEQASALGLDTAKFETDLTSEVTAKIAQQGWEKGNEIGLPGTPLLIINGEILKPPYILESLESLVRLYALPARQYSTCPPFIIDTAKQYTATLKTSKGVIVIELFADKAPNTVNNFVFLAREGWYDNIPFHRVITDFMAQTGDPSGTGMGNPGYFIPDEIDSSLKFDRAGIVGMANSGAGTNGSQFFITYGPANHLNGGYTIFGQVISGMDVLAQITPRDPAQGGTLPEPDMLISITIEER
jgi:cyclophilin family peptidyl-prolyl cis-trans isomerase